MFVDFASAKVGFINFNFAGKGILALDIDFTDSVIKEPCCLLRNAYHLGKLYARDTLLGSGKEINRKKPLIERELGITENRASTNGELSTARGALEGLTIRKRINVLMPAMRAINPFPEAGFEKVLMASIFVRDPALNSSSDFILFI